MPAKRRTSFQDNVLLRMAVSTVLLGMVIAAVPLARAITASVTQSNEPFVLTVTAPPSGAELSGTAALTASASQPASTGTFLLRGTSGTLTVPAGADDKKTGWRGSLSTEGLPSGDYALTFSAVRDFDGITATSKPVSVRLRGTDVSTTQTQPTGTAAETTAQNDPSATRVSVTSPGHMATVSGSVGLSLTASQAADSAQFLIAPSNGGGSTSVNAVGTDGLNWNGTWQGANFPNGVYSVTGRVLAAGVITVSDPVTVTLSNAFTAPTFAVSVESPAAGAIVSGSVPLAASTNQSGSTVDFKVTDSGGTVIGAVSGTGSADGTRWTGSWDSTVVANGTYGVSAHAVREGSAAVAPSRSFTVNNKVAAPDIRIDVLSPSAGAALTDDVQLRAQTSSGVSNVVFYVTQNFGSRLQEEVSAAGSGTSWSGQWVAKGKERGPYALVAKALNGDNAYESLGINFTLAEAAAQPPATAVAAQVRVTSPSAGAVLTGTANVSARTDVAIDGLTFYLRRSGQAETEQVALASGAGSEGGLAWSSAMNLAGIPDGDYLLTAAATRAGARSSSAAVAVKVKSGVTVAPRFELTSPGQGATVRGIAQLSAVSAVALDGVAFRLEGPGIPGGRVVVAAMGSGDKLSWNATWDTAAAVDGTLTVKAVASKDGAETLSAGRTFTVSNKTATQTAPPATTTPVTETQPKPGTGTAAFSVLLERPQPNERFGTEVPLVAVTSQEAAKVSFVIGAVASTVPTAVVEGAYDAGSRRWKAAWPTAGAVNGEYNVHAVAQAAGGQTAQGARVRILVSSLATGDATQQPSGQQPLAPVGEQRPPMPPVEKVTVIPKEEVISTARELPAGSTPLPVQQVPQQVAAAETRLNGECAAAGIAPDRCAAWLNRAQPQANACQAAGIVTKEECAAFLQRTNAVPGCADALGGNDAACAQGVARATAGLLPAEQLNELRESVIPRLGSNVVLPPPPAQEGQPPQPPVQLPPAGVTQAPQPLADSVPLLRPEGERQLVLRLHASPGFEQQADGSTSLTVPAVLMIDADADGLPDDMERRIGTDPNNADTDGDSYPDAVEIERGYNPLGAGKLTDGVQLAPVDVAIVSGAAIEQPRNSGDTNPNLSVESAVSDEADPEGGIAFKGVAVPGAVVTVFVYSYLPVVFTTTANEDGTWQYEMDADLTDGQHEAYVTVTDETGKIQAKSSPLSFFVADAQAVSEDAFFDPTLQSPLMAANVERPEQSLLGLYVGAAGLAVLAALVAAYFIVARRSRPQPPAAA